MSNTEAGRIPVSADRVRAMARNYGCPDTQLIEALANMTGNRSRSWWEEYRDLLPTGLLDLAELEYYATSIRTAQVTHLPGILQTVDYARLVFQQTIPELLPHEVEHRLSHRIKRQAILYGSEPTPFTAVIHEAALRMQFGGSDLTRTQLQHLLKMSTHDSVELLVLPFNAGIFPGAGHTVVYAEGEVGQLDTTLVDTEHGPLLVHSDVALSKYRTVLDRMENMALSPDASRDAITLILNDL